MRKNCKENAAYTCSVCGRLLCSEHSRFRVVCSSCITGKNLQCKITEVSSKKDRNNVSDFVTRFWGEQEQLTFDKNYTVRELPAYMAKTRDKMIGFLSYAEENECAVIVALGVLPGNQGVGVGRKLVTKLEEYAKTTGKKCLLVSTSNDDLPALAFYQAVGFQIYEVKTNVVAKKHGKVLRGIAGLPVRDEIRLRKDLD